MAQTAAHLVDCVILRVPVRQWVLSFPIPLRILFAAHPAMTVPCGMIDGLPVGLILIGKHFEEPAIYRAAYAFEQAGDWKSI